LTNQPVHTDNSKWRFDTHRDRFRFIAKSLVSCDSCAEDLLAGARVQTEMASISAGFEYSYAIRIVVRLALAHIQTCPESRGAGACHIDPNGSHAAEPVIRTLPWPERATFLIRDVLGYSRRHCSLLMGISDANVDEILARAHQHIARATGTSPDSLAVWYQHELVEHDPSPFL
jgi:DNA-directed RNA polymerase specialized sigma24 family protein